MIKKDMQIILEVNSHAERFYEDAVQIGDHAAYALKARHRSQMTGLENIAESALKTSDILDYIKRQTARFPYWRQEPPDKTSPDISFGERLKEYVEKDLATRRDIICKNKQLDIKNVSEEDRHYRRRIYLLLIRQFLRQVVVQYEYRVSFENTRKGT